MLTIDPFLFTDDAIALETRAFNDALVEKIAAGGDMWQKTPAQIRAARTDGNGPFPVEPVEPTAWQIDIPGPNSSPGGDIALRCFKPSSGEATGTYLHIHGGGWTVGTSHAHDSRLQEIANNCALNVVSIEYRLAPEHPYPAGPDDCEIAARWLVDGDHDFPTNRLLLGGESAGANLCASLLLRLKSHYEKQPFDAVQFTAGVFDLGLTPSVRNWGDEKLILNTRDMRMFVDHYLQSGEDRRMADISPLYGDLSGLPPALFSIGTCDLLLDDTLLMATRWHAANGNAQLDVTPGGCHVFQGFPDLAIARVSNAKIDAFLNTH